MLEKRAHRFGVLVLALGVSMACAKKPAQTSGTAQSNAALQDEEETRWGEGQRAGNGGAYSTGEDSASSTDGRSTGQPNHGDPRSRSSDAPADPSTRSPESALGNPLDDEMVDAYARAYVEITRIQQRFQQKVKQTQDTEEARQVQAGFQEKMHAAIQEQGISIAQFRAVSAELDQNPALRRRIEEHIEEVYQ